MEIRVLGPVSAFQNGVELNLGQPQTRAVAAMLALRAGATVAVDELIDGVYGDRAPQRARQVIRSYISRLRQVLGGEVIVTLAGGEGYALRVVPEAVDAVRCERQLSHARAQAVAGSDLDAARLFTEALAPFKAEPLLGVPGPAAESARRRLTALRVAGVEDRAETCLRLGRHAEVAAELAGEAGAHPMNERMHRLLMVARYRSGRQDEAVATYLALRTVLDDELGVAPSAETETAYARILAHDPALMAPDVAPPRHARTEPAHATTVAGPPPPVPRQLPAVVADFTGRSAQLDQLVAALTCPRPLTPALVIVNGMGGVGKTTMALHAAHLAAEVYPDGQLFVDLRGAGPDPMNAGDALAGFLRGLGVAVAPDTPTAELSALYRSALAGRRVLVVLDNAADAAQIAPLMPGSASCAVLTTARRSLPELPATSLLCCDVLDHNESRQLLAAVAGADRVASDPDAADRIVGFCGGLPLALRIAGARLAARASWPPGMLADRLADSQSRLRQLRAGELAVLPVFELGYSQLSTGQARAFTLIGTCDSPDLPAAAVGAALGMDPTQAEDVLESLVDSGIADSVTPGRYRLHDLLKLFARDQHRQDPHTIAQVLAGVLDHYLATLRTGHALSLQVDGAYYLPAVRVATDGPHLTLSDGTHAARWATTELPTLRALLDQIAGAPTELRDMLSDRAADCLLALSALVPLGVRRELFAVADRLCTCLTAPEARTRVDLARLRMLADATRMDQARELLSALTYVRDRGDRLTLLYLDVESFVCFWRGEFDASASAGLAAADLAERLGDQLQAASSTYFAVRARVAAGDVASAAQLHEQARTLDPDPDRNLYGIMALMQLRRARGHVEEALELVRRMATTVHAAGVQDEAHVVSIHEAECLRLLGRLAEAESCADEALAGAERLRDEFDQGRALAVRAQILTDQGRHEQAQRAHDQAQALFASLGLPARPLPAFLY